MFNNLSKREKNMFWIALAVLVVGFYYFQLLQPVLMEKSAMEEQTDSLRQQYRDMLATIQTRLPEVKQKLADLQAEYQTRVAQFPKEAEISKFLFEIEQMASTRGIQFELFTPKRMNDRGDFYDLPVQMTFYSSYPQLVRFIYALEHSAKRMNVVALDVQKSLDPLQKGLQVDLTVNIFIAKQQT